MLEHAAASVGQAAWKVWSHDQTAVVIGVTSRGVFVRAADHIVFISFETYCGPLTTTFERPIDQLRSLEAGAPAHFSAGRAIFPTIAVAIFASPEAIWRPRPAAAAARSPQERLLSLKQIAHGVISRRRGEEFGAVLAPLLDLPDAAPWSLGQTSTLADLQSLRDELSGRNIAQVIKLGSDLLGLGFGLTPSGDDCVVGLLLTLNRWQRHVDWSELNRHMVAAAYRKTTTLSANLIECAADGQADERLIKVVDGIMTGEPSVAECIDCVLGWGSSSGVDALVGMTLVITSEG